MTALLVLLVAGLVILLACEKAQAVRRETAWARERAMLLQRIQAPESAVAAQSRREDPKPATRYIPVALDDDKAMARAHGEEVAEDDDGSS